MEPKPRITEKQGKDDATPCALKITHIGEVLFATVLNADSKLMNKITKNKEKYKAIPEASFTDKNKQQYFDGEHKIDVLLVPQTPGIYAIPIELKLGKTRMKANDSEFGRFLKGYKYSKKYNKFTGSMISILSQKKANQRDADNEGKEIIYPLHYFDDTKKKYIKLSKRWILIVLTHDIAKGLGGMKKNWGGKPPQRIFSFEELFEKNVNLLNEKVKMLIECKDYYEMWLK